MAGYEENMMSDQARRCRRLRAHGLGGRRGRREGGVRGGVRSRSRQGADAMLAGLEKSLARQVTRVASMPAHATKCSVACARSPTSTSSPRAIWSSSPSSKTSRPSRSSSAELDRICAPETILATNTSTLPVVEMAMADRASRAVCGIHFFNPAPVMSLVEVAPRDHDVRLHHRRGPRLRRGVRQDRRAR